MRTQNREQAWAKAALDTMSRHGVAPSPENFELFYRFSSGENPALTRVMEAILESGRPLSPELLSEIGERSLATARTRQTLALVGIEMRQRLNAALEAVIAAREETAAYSRALSAALGDRASPELTRNIAGLRAATFEMAKRLDTFEREAQRLAGDASRFAKRLKDTQKDGMTDSLTGLENRNGFDIGVREAITELAASDDPVSVLLCSVDDLNQVRQSWGSEICDQVLRLVGRRLSDEVKSDGSAARLGNGEFALVLKHTALVEAIRLAASIRANLQSRTLVRKSSGDRLGRIAVSIGVAQYAEGESSADLTKRAEDCLGLARRLGRNIIVGENDPRFTQADIDAA